MTGLVADGAVLRAGQTRLVGPVSAAVPAGTLVALVGPNGAGKTSLLRLLSGTVRPHDGTVLLDGRAAASMAAADRARRIAFQPQSPAPVWAMRADAVVATARFAHGLRGAPRPGSAHALAIDQAMGATDTRHLAARAITTLSGGELARVVLARTLATGAPILLLDEPTAAMDLPHQEAAMALLARLADQGSSLIASVHDLLLACRHADRLWWMDGGRLAGETGPDAASATAMIRAIYGMEADGEDDSDGRMAMLRLPPPPPTQLPPPPSPA